MLSTLNEIALQNDWQHLITKYAFRANTCFNHTHTNITYGYGFNDIAWNHNKQTPILWATLFNKVVTAKFWLKL